MPTTELNATDASKITHDTLNAQHYYIEEWRPVVGYEGTYEVSNFGGVRIVGGRLKDMQRGYKKIAKNQRGYKSCTLNKNKQSNGLFIHCLVAEAFIGPRPDGYQCAHLDGNPSNCFAGNLKWVTPKENASHKKRHGTYICGTRQWKSKVNDKLVAEIINLREEGYTWQSIADRFGISDNTAIRIGKRVMWKHVSVSKVADRITISECKTRIAKRVLIKPFQNPDGTYGADGFLDGVFIAKVVRGGRGNPCMHKSSAHRAAFSTIVRHVLRLKPTARPMMQRPSHASNCTN